MRRLVLAVAALLAVPLMAPTPASAAPVAPMSAVTDHASAIQPVDYRHHWHRWHHHRHWHHRHWRR